MAPRLAHARLELRSKNSKAETEALAISIEGTRETQSLLCCGHRCAQQVGPPFLARLRAEMLSTARGFRNCVGLRVAHRYADSLKREKASWQCVLSAKLDVVTAMVSIAW
jgi:hypothetical protein